MSGSKLPSVVELYTPGPAAEAAWRALPVTRTESFDPAVALATARDRLHLLSHKLDRKKAQHCELRERLDAALAARGEAEEGTALWIVRDRVARDIKDSLLPVVEDLRSLGLEVVETELHVLFLVWCRDNDAPVAPVAVESVPPYWGDAGGWMANQVKANRPLRRGPTLAACRIETGASREKIRAAWGKVTKQLKNRAGRPLKSV
jgi:hypothetical protein